MQPVCKAARDSQGRAKQWLPVAVGEAVHVALALGVGEEVGLALPVAVSEADAVAVPASRDERAPGG